MLPSNGINSTEKTVEKKKKTKNAKQRQIITPHTVVFLSLSLFTVLNSLSTVHSARKGIIKKGLSRGEKKKEQMKN